MSFRIFSKKFSKLFQPKTNSKEIHFFSSCIEIIQSLYIQNKKLNEHNILLTKTQTNREEEFAQTQAELEDQMDELIKKNEDLKEEISRLEKERISLKERYEEEAQLLKEEVNLKNKELDEAFVLRTLKESEIDKQRLCIQGIKKELSVIKKERDSLKEEFSFFCKHVSQEDTEFMFKGLVTQGDSRLYRLWECSKVRTCLYGFLEEGDLSKMQGVSKKFGVLMKRDPFLKVVSLTRKLKGL
jgi:cell division protein FtsB